MSSNRHYARELALQILFSIEVGHHDPQEALTHHLAERLDNETRLFVRELVHGTLDHQNESDELLKPLLHEWSIDRLPIVDRVVLRMAMFEAARVQGAPVAVVIDEAIELVKRFSTEDSARFVNGVLARALTETA